MGSLANRLLAANQWQRRGGGGGKWRESGRKPKSVHGTANEPFLAMALRVGVDVIHHFLGYSSGLTLSARGDGEMKEKECD